MKYIQNINSERINSDLFLTWIHKESCFFAHCFFFFLCRFMEIYLPMRQFFHNLIHPEYSAVTDVYVLMFLADTVDFIIIVFGFWAFGVCFFLHLFRFKLLFTWKLKLTFMLISSRNTQRQTSHRLCRRIRCRDLSWSWSWSSLGPWWWIGPFTSESLSWARSSSRSSCCLASTSGCSSSCQESQKSKNSLTVGNLI